MASPMKQVLHVGCGPYKAEKLHAMFRKSGWQEVRLDIDPAVKPDVVASITDMGGIKSTSMDGVYSSHNLEHLYPHEVGTALKEFCRVLKPEGFALVTCPDIESVAEQIVNNGLDTPLYTSPAGPISPIDILYGHRPSLARGNLFMAHKTGFTAKSLGQAMVNSGFVRVQVKRNKDNYALWALGYKTEPADS